MAIHGKSWKVVAEKLVEQGVRQRTAGNIKDKWKQMGEDRANDRDLGPWMVTEGVNLFKAVCKATGVKCIKKTV